MSSTSSPLSGSSRIRRVLLLAVLLIGLLPALSSAHASAANAPRPFGHLDQVFADVYGVHIVGWAIDPVIEDPVVLEVLVDGVRTGAVLADRPRPDVARALQRGPDHGFDIMLGGLPPGQTLCVSAYTRRTLPLVPIGCGPMPGHNPAFGALDTVTPADNGVRITGWLLDHDTDLPVEGVVVVGDRSTARFAAEVPRPDVAAAFAHGSNRGFDLVVPVEPGRPFCLRVVDAGGSGTLPVRCVTAPPSATPIGVVDVVAAAVTGVRISGWTLDPDTEDPVPVHVYADGVLVADQSAGLARPDVAAATGHSATRGFDLVAPIRGGARVCVYAINRGGGPNPQLGCTVAPGGATPVGVVDSVTWTATTVRIVGWALDPDTSASIDVDVQQPYDSAVPGGVLVVARADQDRPDVAAAGGHGAAHGFDVSLPLPRLAFVCVRARGAGGGLPGLLTCFQRP